MGKCSYIPFLTRLEVVLQKALLLQHCPARPRHLLRRRNSRWLRSRQNWAARSHRQAPLWHQVPDPAGTGEKAHLRPSFRDDPWGAAPKRAPQMREMVRRKASRTATAETHGRWGFLPRAPRGAGSVPRGTAAQPAWRSSRHGAGSTCSEKESPASAETWQWLLLTYLKQALQAGWGKPAAFAYSSSSELPWSCSSLFPH